MAAGCGSRFDNFRSQCIRTERPELKDLYRHVTPCYAAQWKDIGLYLGIELGHLNAIKANHPGDVGGCCKDLWEKWLEQDPDATWDKLFTAIDGCAATSASTSTSIHSTTTSEPATTVKCSPLDVSGLKERYKQLFSPECTDFPQSRIPYIQLALVKGEKVTKADEKITKLEVHGQVDKLQLEKEPLSGLKDIFHYKNKACPRLILIMGGPGIGKTTLCHELCLDWAEDGFLADDFKLVAFIPLCTVPQGQLKEMVVECIGEDNYRELKKSKGDKCLIILEGFDEMKRQDDPFLSSLIENYTIFEKAIILITSRPHACKKIDAGRIIEIVGFEKDKIEKFVKKYFSDDIQSVEFLQQLDKYQLHSLCYIPMNLDMLAKIFNHTKELPSTLTKLYKLFLAMTLNRQVEKLNVAENPAEKVPDYVKDKLKRFFGDKDACISTETMRIVWHLSRLAYRGFIDWYYHREGEDGWEEFKERLDDAILDWYRYRKVENDWEELKEPKIIFTESDLKDCEIEVTSDFDGFGLLKATPTYGLTKNTNTYNFSHLTIQEFLCALYISLESLQEQLDLLWNEYPTIFTFVCGLTVLTSDSNMFKFIYSKLKSPGVVWEGDSDVITAMRCINESKQSSVPHQSVSSFTLNITGKTLLPYDCVCLSHVLSCYPVLALEMSGCYIGDKGAELLINDLTGQLLEELNLSYNGLTSKGMKHVMKIVRTSKATLRMLDISFNDIGDDGMAVISEALQHNKSLATLRVERCGLSVKGADHISQLLNVTHTLQNLNISENELLNVTHTLQNLNISENDISDDGMAVISKALQHNTTLWVAQCWLSSEGAQYIGQLLKVTHTLQELDMSYNDIGDDGMAVISEALQDNKSLITLKVEWNGLSVKGANSICEMMKGNHSLQLLTIGDNIGRDGISAIATALDNCKISIHNFNNLILLIEATPLATASSSNHTIRKIVLTNWGDAITAKEAILTIKLIVDNTVYKLRLDVDGEDFESFLNNWMKPQPPQQPQITESIMENNNNSSDEDVVCRATEEFNKDDHSGGQEETGDHRHEQVSLSKQCCCRLM